MIPPLKHPFETRATVLLGFFGSVLWVSCYSTGQGADTHHLVASRPCNCDGTSSLASKSNPAPGRVLGGGTVNVRIPREPSSLLSLVDSDPIIAAMMDNSVYEPLVRVSADDVVEGALAERFDVDSLNHTYTFYLAEDATWHDGVSVTAHDVVFVFSRLMDPYGALASRTVVSNIREVWAYDEGTVVFELDRGDPEFLQSLGDIPILPEHVFGRTPLALHVAARAPVGSGPFRFVGWVPSQLIELERNPLWRGESPPLSRILYRIVPDDRIALDMFRRGDLDIIPDLPASFIQSPPNSRLNQYRLPRVESWMYNLEHPAFQEAASRRAVSMLIDREAIRCSILRCQAEIVENPWLPIGQEGIHHHFTTYDPVAAERLLAVEGWIDRDGDGVRERRGTPFSFSLLISDVGRDLERIATVIQGDLASAGIDMRIIRVSRGAFVERLKAGEFDAAAISLGNQPFFDGWAVLHSRAIGVSDNYGRFSDGEVDELLDRMREESNHSETVRLAVELSRRVAALQPLTFLFVPHATALFRNDVSGFTMQHGWFDSRRLARTGGGR